MTTDPLSVLYASVLNLRNFIGKVDSELLTAYIDANLPHNHAAVNLRALKHDLSQLQEHMIARLLVDDDQIQQTDKREGK